MFHLFRRHRNHLKKELKLVLLLVTLGQLVFVFLSPGYMKPFYRAQLYTTTGAELNQFMNRDNLNKINEAAHYFGETMIGWLKFPHFIPDAIQVLNLPEDTRITAHLQERQNMIFTLESKSEISHENLMSFKDYMQSRIDKYNDYTKTKFVLLNADYSQSRIERPYLEGALITLLITLLLGGATIFIRREILR